MEPVYSPRNAGKILGVTTHTIQVWDRERRKDQMHQASDWKEEGA
ncbi:MAG: hypothetical protein QXX17_03615 [Conexivisphaerales archaeon]